MKRASRIVPFIVFLIVAIGVEEVVRGQYRRPIGFTIYESDTQRKVVAPLWAWTARRVLLNLRPTKEDIELLNQDAGARYVATIKDPVYARLLLTRLREHGLDLEALDTTGQWTAVQIVAMEGNLEAVQMLLAGGAQAKKINVEGRLLRDLLDQLATKNPDMSYPEIVRVLQL